MGSRFVVHDVSLVPSSFWFCLEVQASLAIQLPDVSPILHLSYFRNRLTQNGVFPVSCHRIFAPIFSFSILDLPAERHQSKKREAEDFLRDQNELSRRQSLLFQWYIYQLRSNIDITQTAMVRSISSFPFCFPSSPLFDILGSSQKVFAMIWFYN